MPGRPEIEVHKYKMYDVMQVGSTGLEIHAD